MYENLIKLPFYFSNSCLTEPPFDLLWRVKGLPLRAIQQILDGHNENFFRVRDSMSFPEYFTLLPSAQFGKPFSESIDDILGTL